MSEQYKSTLQLLLPAPSPDSILPDALIATPVQQAAVAIAPEPVVPDALITVQVTPQTIVPPEATRRGTLLASPPTPVGRAGRGRV